MRNLRSTVGWAGDAQRGTPSIRNAPLVVPAWKSVLRLIPPDPRGVVVRSLTGDGGRETGGVDRQFVAGVREPAPYRLHIRIRVRTHLDGRRIAGAAPLAPRFGPLRKEGDPLLHADLIEAGGATHVRDARLRKVGRSLGSCAAPLLNRSGHCGVVVRGRAG